MVNHHVCSVLNCYNNGRNSQCTFYNFPTANWKLDQRNKWIKAVNRKNKDGSPWVPKHNSKICSDHFVGGKKSELPASPSYVPSIFSKHTIATVVPEDPLAVPEPVKHETPEHVVPTFCQLTAPKEVPIEPFVPEDDYRCKDCAANTDGFTWWCVQCACGALCGACALRPPHDAHYMLRAPQGATRSQTQAVLAVIRQLLLNENLMPLHEVEKSGVKLEVKLEPEDPPSPLPEPVLDAMLETALDTEPDPVLDVTLDREPAFDTLQEATLDPAMESDPLSTESDDARNEVAEMKEDKELEEYLAKRQRYMETIKTYHNKTISVDTKIPEPSLDPVLETLDLTMEPDPLTTEPDDAGKQVSEMKESEELEEYLAKRQRYMETIKPYYNKPISEDPEPSFDPVLDTLDLTMEPDPLTTEPEDAGKQVAEMNEDKELEEYLAKRQRYMETIKPYYSKPISEDPVLETLDLTMEPDPLTTEPEDAGKQVSETENEELKEYLAKRQRYMETIKPYHKKTIFRYNPRSPNCLKTIANEETTALKDNPRGSQTLQTPVFLHLYSSSNLGGSQNLQAPSNPTGSQTRQTPSNIKRVETLQTPSNVRGSQTVRVPSSLRGSQTVRAPSNIRGSQTQQTPSKLKRSIQTPSNPGCSRLTVLKVMPSDLIRSSTAKTSPGSAQTVSKPNNQKIKRTILKVPISELGKSKTIHFRDSNLKSIRKVKPSELLKLKKVHNVQKNTAVLTQQNDSKELKLHNVLKGLSIPLKVTSGPPRYNN